MKVSSFLKRAAVVAVGVAAVFAAGEVWAAKKSSLDYVQKGLVAQWDGVENAGRFVHDPNAACPVELTGNLSTTLTGTMTAHDTWFEFGSGDLSFVSSELAAAINAGHVTVEICLATNSTLVTNGGFIDFGTSSRGFWAWQNTSYFLSAYSYHSTHNQYTALNSNDGGTNTLSFVLGADTANSSFVTNGVRKSGLTRQTTDMKTGETCYLGKISGYNRANAKVFAVRIYDRVLSADELAANRAIDETRFVDEEYATGGIVVNGTPDGVGESSPAYGVVPLEANERIVCRASVVWTNDAETIGATCRGWTLTQTNGTVTSGSELEKEIVYTPDMTGATLTWNWDVDYKVTASSEAGGQVSNAEEWVRRGGTFVSTFSLTDGTDTTRCFRRWADANDKTLGRETTFSFVVDSPQVITAKVGRAVYAEPGNGFDDAGNGTIETPFSPIAYALDHVTDGDTLILKTGTYDVKALITLASDVTIRSLTGNKNDVLLKNVNNHRLITLNHKDARLTGVILDGQNVKVSGSGCGVGIGANGGMLDHVTVRKFPSGSCGSNGGGVYVSASDNALVDSVVISNCTCWAEGSGGGHAIYQAGGVVRNSLFIHNDKRYNGQHDNIGGTVKISGGLMTHCTVACNTGDKTTPGIWTTSASPKVRNCIIAGNKDTTKLDTTEGAWQGTASCFSNCVCSSTINEFCYLEKDPYEDLAKENLLPSPASKAMNGSALEPWMVGTTDLAGNPRVSGTAPDMGAYEKCATDFSADFSGDVSQGFAPLTVNYTVYVNGIAAADVACLWDWNGDGVADETTFGLTASHEFGFGTPAVGLVVSNRTTGATYAVPRKLTVKSVSKTLYVVKGNKGAEAPYGSWATAAKTVEAAAAAAIAGCTIIISNGTHDIAAQIVLDRAVKVRGFTGKPENVILKASGSKYRLFQLNDTEAALFDLTLQGASGVAGAGVYINSSGGTLSNVVVRSCLASTYGNRGGGILIAAPKDNTVVSLVDSCVVSNCESHCESGGSGGNGIAMDGGIVRNSLILFNKSRNMANGGGGAVRAWGGEVVNCTIAKNSSGVNATGVYASGTAEIRNCIIAENTFSTTEPLKNQWMGTGSCFTNCVCAIAIDGGKHCFVEVHPFADISIMDLTPAMDSDAIDGCEPEPWMVGRTDLKGVSRISGPKPDIGALEFDKSKFSAQFSADVTQGFSPVKVTYTVTASGAEADEVACYWDWTGDGVPDEMTTGLTATHTFSNVVVDVSLLVSNKTTGATFPVVSKANVKAVERTLYVRNGSVTPLSPYSTWETAAATIPDAADAAIAGCTILVSNGTHTVSRTFKLEQAVTVRGLDGIATNVIVKPTATGYRFCQLADSGAAIRDMTIQNFTVDANGGGVYINALGGMVSNCVIRGCKAYPNYSKDGGGIYIEATKSGCQALVDTVVISNCQCHCETGGGCALRMNGGTVRNSLFMQNLAYNCSNGGGTVFVGGGRLENCTIAFNTMAVCPGVWATGGKVVSCIIAENKYTGETDVPLKYAWRGTASCFENCVCSIEIEGGTNCYAEEHPFASLSPLDLSPAVKSKAYDGAEEEAWMRGSLDILGRPRIAGDAPDIGAVEALVVPLSADFEAVGSAHGFAPLTVAFAVTVHGAEEEELDCYWDWGDGSETEKIEGSSASHQFPLGVHDVRLRIVNRTTGTDFTVVNPVEVRSIARTLYVRDGDQTARAPYASWATAATNINHAVDMAIDGCEIVVADGECRAPEEVVVTKALTIRGQGRMETVVKSVGTGHRVFQLHNAGAKVCDMTVCGAWVKNQGVGFFINSAGGTVSNVFVHSCSSASDTGIGGGIYVTSSAGLVDSVIVSNCYASSGTGWSGGTALAMTAGDVRNSLFVRQQSPTSGDASPMGTVAVWGGTLANCTIAHNDSRACAGIYATGGKVVNCLVVTNTTTSATAGYNVYACDALIRDTVFTNCMGEVRMSKSSSVATNVFRNVEKGDYRLTATSPAVDKGAFQDWMTGAVDLSGRPRVSHKIPDIGAYEYPKDGFTLIVR